MDRPFVSRFARRLGVVALACITFVGALCGAPAVFAQAAEKRDFDVAAQPLDSALRQVAESQHLQILYDPAQVKGVVTQGVKGRYTAREAVAKLLEGTQLVPVHNGNDAIAIRPKREDGKAGAAGGWSQNPTLLAQAQSPSAGANEEAVESRRSGATAERLEKIEVTGSRVLRAGVEGPQPVRSFTREQIEASGKTTLPGFLSTLPETSVSFGSTVIDSVFGQYNIQLRGLPRGSTLVLINGRRVEPGGASSLSGALDLNLIPLGAIERIEVLPIGSSAVYGSDALAGVVNLILRREGSRTEVDVRYSHAGGLDQETASIAVGKAFDRGSISIIGTYFNSSSLFGTERSITSDMDYRRFGGLDRRSTTCSPGNVYSTSGSNLPGLSTSQAAIPPGLTGAPTIGAFSKSDGSLNRCGFFGDQTLVPKAQRAGVFATASYRLIPQVEIFAELLASRSEQTTVSFARPLSRTRLPASNAFNPFGTDVLVDYNFGQAVRLGNQFDTTFMRPLVGMRGRINDTWDWQLAACHS